MALLLQVVRAGTAATSGFVENGAQLFAELEERLLAATGDQPEGEKNPMEKRLTAVRRNG